MKLTESELRTLYRDLQKEPSSCLSEELLLRAGAGRLGEAERENVSAHIAACPRCAREYQIAYAIRPVAEVFDMRHKPRLRWIPLAAAAVLAGALLFVTWMAGERHSRDRATMAALEARLRDAERRLAQRLAAPPPQQISELSRSQIEMPIVDLEPQPTRAAQDDPVAVSLSPTSDLFALILHLDAPVRDVVSISIINEQGATVWRAQWRAPAGASNLTLTLHRRQFPPGSYRLRLGSVGYGFRVVHDR
jgi:hypothetical protein